MTKRQTLPKYQVIRDELMVWMESGALSPGDRLPIEAELAKHFAVSRQTVRQAVGELVQQGYLERKQGSGTYVVGASAKPVKRAVSGIVGVVTTYISDYIFPDIIRGIVDRLSEDNVRPLLYSTQNDPLSERKALEDILHKDADAVIVEAAKTAHPNPNLDLYRTLTETGVPVVMLHARPYDVNLPLVEVDDRHGAQLVVHHLIELGHRHIGALIKLDDLQGLRRMEGFTDALGQHGLPFTAQSMSFYSSEEEPLVAEHYARRLARLAPAQRPTAVFCYNDNIAAGLLRELRDNGIQVPAEISVAGFDDASIAGRAYPTLTTVTHPKYDLGVKVADMVLASLCQGAPDPLVYTFTPALVVRDSTASVSSDPASPSSPLPG